MLGAAYADQVSRSYVLPFVKLLMFRSDLHEYRLGPINTRIEPHSITGETLPAVCGTRNTLHIAAPHL